MTSSGTGKYVLILKMIDDPRLRYVTAKKLAEMWPETTFVQWKAKVEGGETLVLARDTTSSGIRAFKDTLVAIGAPVEVIEQKTIGGKPVF